MFYNCIPYYFFRQQYQGISLVVWLYKALYYIVPENDCQYKIQTSKIVFGVFSYFQFFKNMLKTFDESMKTSGIYVIL